MNGSLKWSLNTIQGAGRTSYGFVNSTVSFWFYIGLLCFGPTLRYFIRWTGFALTCRLTLDLFYVGRYVVDRGGPGLVRERSTR